MVIPANPGTVYLVGAGPGDPTLITVRGLALLRQADVVIYDRLVHPALVEEALPTAECIYVGKSHARHTLRQEEINALLVERAQQGHVVVRLKGGDPFVFGRGGEEGGALALAGVPFEIVPGVSSAIGALAYAGIPVTHRGVASAFTVVTGHLSDPAAEHDWATLARAGTLVILMGVGRFPEIARRLVEHGCAPETPVAVVRCGTTADQVVVQGTLAGVGEQVALLRPPAVIVVGEVVNLRTVLAWFSPSHAVPTGFLAEDRVASPEPLGIPVPRASAWHKPAVPS